MPKNDYICTNIGENDMRKLKINGHVDIESGSVKFSLDIYIFKEGALTYSYCPSLDITGYGEDSEAAKSEMEYQLKEYFDYTMRKDTLRSDLAGHGWTENEGERFTAPSVSYLMRRYPDFKDLIENREYLKYSQSVGTAAYA